MSAPVDVFQLDLSLMPRFSMMQFAAQLGGLATFISGLISLAMVIVERELLYKLLMAVWISPLCWPCRKVAQTYKEKAAARKEAAKKAREARALAKQIAKEKAMVACKAAAEIAKALLRELPEIQFAISIANDQIALLKVRAAKAAAAAALVALYVREDITDIKRMYLAAKKEAMHLEAERKQAEAEAKKAEHDAQKAEAAMNAAAAAEAKKAAADAKKAEAVAAAGGL
jgi:hypothetical protein